METCTVYVKGSYRSGDNCSNGGRCWGGGGSKMVKRKEADIWAGVKAGQGSPQRRNA